ncbi:MAG: hypothetical protein NTX15_03245 [Candidatus Kapabacteria bacterium]|nr:hypothetical protein [Candidatus Kapabacteria bacterium]
MRWITFFLAFGCLLAPVNSQDCKDRVLLDATQRVFNVGLDSSGRWWALSHPFENLVGLTIDGVPYGPYEVVLPPKISFDGSMFVAGVRMLGQWSVLTEDDTISLNGDVLQETYFPSMSATPWWLQSNGNDRRLSTYDRSYRCVNEPRMVSLDPQGLVVAWVERRGNVAVLFVSGKEQVTADDITLGGVWADGLPLFAVRFGMAWSVYHGQDEIASSLASLTELRINPSATVCSWTASDGTGGVRIYVYTTEMNAPWTSMPLQAAAGLIISPFDALSAARVTRNGNTSVIFGGAEFPAGLQSGPFVFSHTGEFMAFAGLEDRYFVTVNGKRQWIRSAINLDTPLSVNSDGSAVAWASATTIAYVKLEPNVLRLGKMCDTMGPVIYDRRSKTFKGLGFVSGRLFLLECDPR